jgi:predicted alpha/beta superfamily hydrolase
MKIHILFSIILLFSIYLSAQEVKVKFIVTSPKLNDSSSVYITGMGEKLGNWDPSVVKLNKQKDDTWSIDLSFTKGNKLEYKFTLGSWGKEGLNDRGGTPGNYHLTVNNDTIVFVEINKWGGSVPAKVTFKGQITGNVKYHRNFQGIGLRPRDIIVWLPPSYEMNTDKRYPVLYAHDGQNLFDPATSAFGIDWQLDETADSLIRQGKINEMIIVGLYNTPARMKEYWTGDTGRLYMNFVVNQVKPFIDKTYRTLPDRKNTASIGSSAGGLISFMLLWEHNDIFSKAACISPAFFIKGELDYVSTVTDYKGPRKKLKAYFDCGGIGLESILLPGATKMISLLKRKGYKEDKDYLWYYDKNAEHNEPNWAKRAWRPLEFLYGK